MNIYGTEDCDEIQKIYESITSRESHRIYRKNKSLDINNIIWREHVENIDDVYGELYKFYIDISDSKYFWRVKYERKYY
jgi:hypothetical protein